MTLRVKAIAKTQSGFWEAMISQRSVTAFVWAVWLTLLLIDLLVLAKFGRKIPIFEDWLLVPPLTGNEPNLAGWLWEQNNEHRIPVPRLILLGLLKLTGGDWRTGMLFDIILLSLLSVALILVARRLRKGRTILADALFPIVLLSLGNWENLYWNWQVTFILPLALTCALLLIIVTIEKEFRPISMIAAGVVLILLPLNGANGLLWLPSSLLYFTYYGARCWLGSPRGSSTHRAAGFLLAAIVISVVITALYFVGLTRPGWSTNPGILLIIDATLQILALGIGPVARSARIPAIAITVLIFIPTTMILARAAYRFLGSKEEMRVIGLLAFLGNGMLFAIAIGYGRMVLRL